MASALDRLCEALVGRGHSRVAERLRATARAGIGLRTTKLDADDLPVGSTKIGGDPDVPPDFEWPSWKGCDLGFLVQLNLADFRPFECCSVLPASGLLQFYYLMDDPFRDVEPPWGNDPEDEGAWRVYYLEPDQALERRAPPPGFEGRLIPCSVSTYAVETIVPPDTYSPTFKALGLSPEEVKAFFEVEVELDSAGHRLLGHPEQVQNDMARECAIASNGIVEGPDSDPAEVERFASGWPEWRLLLQLDSLRDDSGMDWGLGGFLYFWIREADLRARRFDKVWLRLQST